MKVKVDGKKVTMDGKVREFGSKSEIFRWLYEDQKMTISSIAKLTGARYQFVYSVIDSHTDGNIRKQKRGPSKSDKFREYYDKGMKVGEIAKKTNSNYTFVYTVIKKYKASKKEDK